MGGSGRLSWSRTSTRSACSVRRMVTSMSALSSDSGRRGWLTAFVTSSLVRSSATHRRSSPRPMHAALTRRRARRGEFRVAASRKSSLRGEMFKEAASVRFASSGWFPRGRRTNPSTATPSAWSGLPAVGPSGSAAWDDHAVTKDASRAGAENQDPGEGPYFARKTRAQRVYDKDAGADGRHRLFRRLQWRDSPTSTCAACGASGTNRSPRLRRVRCRSCRPGGRP